ncbi:heat shock protein 83 [Backusella circina FSU 941]|nr:heat shock protein 83 [Backusella circina FSU 941]
MTKETYKFQAEISQLMSLIINTFYSNKEIFLRELISNSSDALDKVRYASLTDPDILASENELFIRIIPDKQRNMLIIRDTGIGMTKPELINNLGTIAKSGTKAFMEAISLHNDGNINMIGQFGVGFYSAFLVADKVQFISKSRDDEQYIWECGASGFFTITRDLVNPCLTRGSEVRLFLKDNQLEYLDEKKIREVIKIHSEYISYPIQLMTEKEVELDSGHEESSRVKEIITETQELNLTKPLWTYHPNEVRFEEYALFYKAHTNDWQDPLAVKHFSVEGQLEFRALLFLPRPSPSGMFESKTKTNGIKLYVRRVFIMDNCKELMPEWLSFVKGIVDSEDLPLNISRETLQQSKILRVIRKNLVKKSIEMFHELIKNREYQSFYDVYASKIKLGLLEDDQNRVKLAELLRFYSTKSMDKMISFDDYVERMHESQKCIYYMVSESRLAAFYSPFLENFKKKDLEVFLMVDPIDEYTLIKLNEYNDIPLVCVTKEGVGLEQQVDEATEQARQIQEQQYKTLCMAMKRTLGDKVENVVLSHLLSDSACVLTTSHICLSANMERIMKVQAPHSPGLSAYMASQRILELNPDHPIIQKLARKPLYPIDRTTEDLILLLFDTALLISGFSLDNPTHFANRINQMISLGLGANEEENDGTEEYQHLFHVWHTR